MNIENFTRYMIKREQRIIKPICYFKSKGECENSYNCKKEQPEECEIYKTLIQEKINKVRVIFK